MKEAQFQAIVRRPAVVIAGLLILVIVGFWGVNRLVRRFGEQRKALARHLYERSQVEQRKNQAEAAIEDLRAALDYDPSNFGYQLALARLLRDTGNIQEAESYLISLWERDPQNGLVNVALARLYVRQHSIEKAIQYYHNAIYGVWPSDAESQRLAIQQELVQFLIEEKTYAQAQAELISWSSALPVDSNLHLIVADLFKATHDYDHALAEYQKFLRRERNNPEALAGAGEAVFLLGRYRTAQNYFQDAIRAGNQDVHNKKLLETSTTILNIDPFGRRISTQERNQRVRQAFSQAGKRLANCAQDQKIKLPPMPGIVQASEQDEKQPSPQHDTADNLPALAQRWIDLRSRVVRLNSTSGTEIREAAMDLVFTIEQQTQTKCGPPSELDEGLLLLSQNPTGVEQ
jgi:tetratricopeptide (TPR) repeat protein